MPTAKHIKAVEMHGRTMVGVMSAEFPLTRGNCFSVKGEDGHYYQIVNFVAENLDHLTENGLKWPIHIAVLHEGEIRGVAAINDPRIGDRWYQERWCEVCCPEGLLPIPQVLRHRRLEARGERTCSSGWVSSGPVVHPPQFP